MLFPHCLVCIFDPCSQDQPAEAAWTVLSAAPKAVAASKSLVFGVAGKEITPELIAYTAGEPSRGPSGERARNTSAKQTDRP